jgi:hypothetical protein
VQDKRRDPMSIRVCCECQVLDLLGGPSAECDARIDRSNTVTGASFLWEQDGFSPVSTSCQP